jgi:hypothetical protein
MIPLSEDGHWRWHVGALAVYTVCSLLFIDHGVSITANILGFYSDPYLYIWFLEWWPWSIMHHLNPFYTNLVWQPGGLNLAWTTTIPLLAFVTLPATLLCGPVLSYNLLVLAAPILAALAAYCLCLWLTQSPAASLFGGYVFGFSTYEMTETLDHLNLSFTVLVPLILFIFLRRLKGEMPRRRAVALLGLSLAGQFLVSIEIFATVIFFSTLAWAIALICLPAQRKLLLPASLEALAAIAFSSVLVSPILFQMFIKPDHLDLPAAWPFRFSNDFLSFFVPTFSTAAGGMFALPITSHFSSYIDEEGAYLGLPFIVIAGLFARRYWRSAFGKFLLLTALCILIASLGPQLWVGGIFTRIVMPWYGFLQLPLISAAEPDRFIMYVWLILAVITAIWLAGLRGEAGERAAYLLAIAGCLFIAPVAHPVQPVPLSRFFAPGRVQQVLGPNPKLLILPFGFRGDSTFWQEENHYGFAQTGGYLGVAKAAGMDGKAVRELSELEAGPELIPLLRAFCAATGTGFIIAGPGTSSHMMAMLKSLSWPSRQVDDVTIFTVRPAPNG